MTSIVRTDAGVKRYGAPKGSPITAGKNKQRKSTKDNSTWQSRSKTRIRNTVTAADGIERLVQRGDEALINELRMLYRAGAGNTNKDKRLSAYLRAASKELRRRGYDPNDFKPGAKLGGSRSRTNYQKRLKEGLAGKGAAANRAKLKRVRKAKAESDRLSGESQRQRQLRRMRERATRRYA